MLVTAICVSRGEINRNNDSEKNLLTIIWPLFLFFLVGEGVVDKMAEIINKVFPKRKG
jgi:hypothetical protein